MKQSVLGVLLFFLCFQQTGFTQNCPPPEQFQMIISEDVPPVATLTWLLPPGGSVTGFSLTYMIDNQPPVTVALSAQTTTFSVVLPLDWSAFEANIVSVCGTEQSGDQTVRKENLIIIDLVLARSAGAPEALVCQNICQRATHFGYSGGMVRTEGQLSDVEMLDDPEGSLNGTQGAGLQASLYHIERFCNCMALGNNDFGNPVLVEDCKVVARDRKDLSLYNVVTCFTLAPQPRNGKFSGDFQNVNITPNPFQTQLQLNGLPAAMSGQFHLLNATGQLVWQISLSEAPETITLNIPEMMPGIYFYQLISNDGRRWGGRLWRQ
jgi:hypothetical protein